MTSTYAIAKTHHKSLFAISFLLMMGHLNLIPATLPEKAFQTGSIEWMEPIWQADTLAWESQILPIRVLISSNAPVDLAKEDIYFLHQGFLIVKIPANATLTKKSASQYELSCGFEFSRPGRQEIRIMVKKATQLALESKSLLVNYAPNIPNLYILAIAPKTTLFYSTKDAKDFSRAFIKQSKAKGGKLYNKVIIDTLIGQDATKANIQKKIEGLSLKYGINEITKNDCIILYIASHGFLDETKGLRLQAEDFDKNNINSTSISFQQEIADVLSPIVCKKLIFIDACFSAGRQAPSIIYDQINKINSTLVGTTTFVSSQGDEPSYEHKDWGNGAFTEAVIEGLFYGRADKDWNQFITVGELAEYVKLRVPKMVKDVFGKAQHPRVLINELNDLEFFFKN